MATLIDLACHVVQAVVGELPRGIIRIGYANEIPSGVVCQLKNAIRGIYDAGDLATCV